MESLYWTIGIIAIVFYTLWVSGAFKKRSNTTEPQEQEMKTNEQKV